MANQLQRLMFSINLLDRVTGPAGRIQQSLQNTANSAQDSFAKIGLGAAGLAGAGYAMKSLLGPAIEMDRALGEVRSLEVAEDALKSLSDTALKHSIRYGVSASEFVSASYSIKSAISSLNDSDLARFTEVSGVLAKATKADAATITGYMGKMYNIFEKQAEQMGTAKWAEVLAGQTATAVQMFNTTGQEMSDAFKGIASNAEGMGRSMAEQMALVGHLQGVWSGSEAGTKYKSFLSGVGRAQEQLGLQFTDSSGRMLGVVEILDAIKGKFGETLEVAEADALKKAFGSDDSVAFVTQLMGITDNLAASINKLGKVKGMEKAMNMADAMVDPWQRLDSGIFAVSASLGGALLPIINPLVDSMANGSATMTRWSKMFPTLTQWVGIGVTSIFGLIAAIALLTIASGLSGGAMIIWGAVVGTKNVLTRVWAASITFLRGALLGQILAIQMSTTATRINMLATTAWAGAVTMANGLVTLLSGGLSVFRTVMIGVNAVLFANPIGLVVAGVTALIAIVGAAIYYWDDLKAAFLDTTWGQNLMVVLDGIIGYFKSLSGIAGQVIDWVIEKINMIPGVEVGGGESTAPDINSVNNQLKTAAVAPGQVTNNIKRAVNNHSSSQNAQQVTIHTTQPMTPQLMDGWMMMEGA